MNPCGRAPSTAVSSGFGKAPNIIYLWNEAVRHWKAKNSSNKRSAAKEKKVPMEPARLPQRELAGLGSNAADIL